MKHCV